MAIIPEVLGKVKKRNPNEPEFLQAVNRGAGIDPPVIERKQEVPGRKILERLVEPDAHDSVPGSMD